ncbi:hypothetical protein KKB55_06295, partial [Myxococcota bacterium]|nr:hypothetical protein [Myxococcota bacterium]
PRSTEPRSFEPRSQPAEPVASEPTPAPSAAAPSAPTTPTPTLMRRPTLPKGRATGSSTRPLDLSGLKQQPQRRATASLSLLSPPTTPSKERTRLDPGDDVGDMSLLGSEDMLFMMDGVLSPSSIPSEDDDNAIHLTDPSPTQFVPFPTPYRTGHAIDPLLLSYFIEVSKPSFE